MRFWPRRKQDEGGPPYHPLSAAAFTRCAEGAWEIVQYWDPGSQTVKGRWCWSEDAFKEALLEEAVGAAALAELDQAAREQLLARISEEQYGAPRRASRAERRRWRRVGIEVKE